MSEEEEDNQDLLQEQEEEEEDDEEKSKKENIKNNIKKVPKQSHSYYISIINQLKKEIESEKKINSNTKKSELEIEYDELKNELKKKKSILEKLKSTNKKQKSALNILTKRLESGNNKQLENDEDDTLEKNNDNDFGHNKHKIRNNFNSEEDKKLNKAVKTMKNLRIQNDILFKQLYENKDYTDKIILEDLGKEMKGQLDQKNHEKNLLIKQLQSHINCQIERNKLNESINKLIIELKNIKLNIQKSKDKIDDLLLTKNKNINIPNLSYEKNKKIDIISKANNPTAPKLIKIINKSSLNIYSNNSDKNIIKKKISLPLISIKKYQNDDSFLSEEFTKKLNEQFKDNELDYKTLMKKIKMIETNRKQTENKHKNEINEKNNRLNSLDEKYKLMKIERKLSDFQSNILKSKLNNFTKENKQKIKQIKELEEELKKKNIIFKSKKDEISKLVEQINYIRSLVSLGNIKIEDERIKKYVEKIKNEKRLKTIENKNKEEEVKNDMKIDKKLETKNTKNEESMQADFSENDTNKNNQKEKKTTKKRKKLKKK
jgi:hypothetical protein